MHRRAQLWRSGITLVCLGFGSVLPATAWAQPPVYVTQWGTQGSGDAQFSYTEGMATDASGNLYVADFFNQRIQKFTGTGTYLAQWGSGGSGNGQFGQPLDVATDVSGNVYVVDSYNKRVQKFTDTGVYLTQWGSPGSGNGQFEMTVGVATDIAGNVYVTDYLNNRVQKFTGSGVYLGQWGSSGSGDGQFYYPTGVVTDAPGNVYVAEEGNHRVQKFSSSGVYITQWGSRGNGDGQFYSPEGLATDAAGNVYVADTGNSRIQKFSGSGIYLTQWGSRGSGDGQFIFPQRVTTDAAGNVFVSDTENHRIQKFSPAPTPVSMAFDVSPSMLNLAAHGLWMTGFLEPPAPHAASDIDVSSVRLNGTVAVDPAAPTAIGDHDSNGVPDLMVKFNRIAVELTLADADDAAIVVTGEIGSESFQGSDHIRVRHVPVSAPVAGAHLSAGAVTQVRWQTPSGVRAESAALLHSFDDGATWSLIARGLANTGSYDWAVPNVQARQAKVAVVLAESSDESGNLVDGMLGVSETFAIEGIVGVGEGGQAVFALRGVTPNPSPRELRVSFSLRDSKPATLALFDVSGRQLESRRVDGMGPGWHSLTLGARSHLSAGLYLIRLTEEGRSVTTRAAVVR